MRIRRRSQATDAENWAGDIQAWGLTPAQQVHHFHRLHTYHRRIAALHWRRYERTQRIETALGVLLFISLAITALVVLA